MKKVKLIVLSLLTLAMLAGCSGNKDKQLDEILKSGKLIVTTSPDYPPMEFFGDDGEVYGSDILLAQFIADELGVELVIETMEFGATYTALDFNKANLSISGYGWQDDRMDAYEFSDAYNDTDDSESSCQGLIIKTADLDKYTSFEAMDGIRVAAQVNSMQEAYTKAQVPNVQLVSVQTIDVAMMSLNTDKADAVAVSCNIAKAYSISDPELSKATVEFDLGSDAMHPGNFVLAKKGETSLIAKVNEILKKVNDEGLYIQWDLDAKAKALEFGIDFESDSE